MQIGPVCTTKFKDRRPCLTSAVSGEIFFSLWEVYSLKFLIEHPKKPEFYPCFAIFSNTKGSNFGFSDVCDRKNDVILTYAYKE